jgi:hypothetical protein
MVAAWLKVSLPVKDFRISAAALNVLWPER